MTKAGRVLSQVLLAILALVLGVLCVGSVALTVWLSLGKTGELTQNMHIFTLASPTSWPILAGGVVGFVLVGVLLRWAWSCGSLLDDRRAPLILIAVVTLVSAVCVICLGTVVSDWGDSWMINDFVDSVVSGGWSALTTGPAQIMDHDARLYFACYPFQSWWLFWCLWLKLAFGGASLVVIQLTNVAANALTLVCLVRIGRLVLCDPRARRLLLVLLALCLPLYWLCTFVYGNAVGMGLGMLFLLLQARALSASDLRGRLRLVALSALPLLGCLCFKATFVLFAIGAVVCWALVALTRRDGWPLVALLVVILAANSVSKLPAIALGQLTGIDTSSGMTTLNHLELGLRDDMNEFSTTYDDGAATVSPGGWSRHSSDVWEETGGDAAAQNASALASVGEDLSDFASDPAYALWFFGTKLSSEWCDPTFQSLYYVSMGAGTDGARHNPVDLSTIEGLVNEGLTFVLDGYQSIVYLGSAVALVVMARKRCPGGASLLLPCTFFAGFGCYLLWEAKSVYTFPFFLVLLPVAAAGLASLFAAWDGHMQGARS